MKVFNHKHFVRHISMPTLQEFTQAHILAPNLQIDWACPVDQIPELVNAAVEIVEGRLVGTELSKSEREPLERGLYLWQDDLRRAHLMSNDYATQEFLTACTNDDEVLQAFASRDEREKALWMMINRDKSFRDAELHVAFKAKTNGRYWKKHRIQSDLTASSGRADLEAFSADVATLFKKSGGGSSTHVEYSYRNADGSVQLTIYVEGPVTAIAHFSEQHFQRITTRIALETALVYQPTTGIIETVVKGGGKNHTAVLALFGQHVVHTPLQPEEIEKTRYKLNELRDGLMEPFEDWSHCGVEKVRLRRAQFTPKGASAISIGFEASPYKDEPDAIHLALEFLKFKHSLEADFNMDGATVIVYTQEQDDKRVGQFSFDVYSSGSSTINNLPVKNKKIAQTVLQALGVVDSEVTSA